MSLKIDFVKILELAERGDVDAQVKLGKVYCDGERVQKDLKEVAVWYHKKEGRHDIN